MFCAFVICLKSRNRTEPGLGCAEGRADIGQKSMQRYEKILEYANFEGRKMKKNAKREKKRKPPG